MDFKSSFDVGFTLGFRSSFAWLVDAVFAAEGSVGFAS
jgi:hypothetical protein